MDRWPRRLPCKLQFYHSRGARTCAGRGSCTSPPAAKLCGRARWQSRRNGLCQEGRGCLDGAEVSTCSQRAGHGVWGRTGRSYPGGAAGSHHVQPHALGEHYLVGCCWSGGKRLFFLPCIMGRSRTQKKKEKKREKKFLTAQIPELWSFTYETTFIAIFALAALNSGTSDATTNILHVICTFSVLGFFSCTYAEANAQYFIVHNQHFVSLFQ